MRSLRRLVGRPVRIDGRHSGSVKDVVLRLDLSTALGAIVEDTDGKRAFLPWAAARADADGLAISAATAILGTVELDYYLASGIPFASVKQLAVDDGAGGADAIADVLVTDGGRTWGLELAGAGRTRVVRLDEMRVRPLSGRPTRLSVDLGAAA